MRWRYAHAHMNEARGKQTFDVFLSHNSRDKPVVGDLAAQLMRRPARPATSRSGSMPAKAARRRKERLEDAEKALRAKH